MSRKGNLIFIGINLFLLLLAFFAVIALLEIVETNISIAMTSDGVQAYYLADVFTITIVTGERRGEMPNYPVYVIFFTMFINAMWLLLNLRKR